MPKRIPVTTYINGDGVSTFVVITLCGQNLHGMTDTPDLQIQTRKALAHAETCYGCAERWEILNRPGTVLTIAENFRG
jgi:hypothetical protein